MKIAKKAVLDPAHDVVEKLGGTRAVADMLGLKSRAVCMWKYPRPSGNGGMIPQAHWKRLLNHAKRMKVPLTKDDLSA